MSSKADEPHIACVGQLTAKEAHTRVEVVGWVSGAAACLLMCRGLDSVDAN